MIVNIILCISTCKFAGDLPATDIVHVLVHVPMLLYYKYSSFFVLIDAQLTTGSCDRPVMQRLGAGQGFCCCTANRDGLQGGLPRLCDGSMISSYTNIKVVKNNAACCRAIHRGQCENGRSQPRFCDGFHFNDSCQMDLGTRNTWYASCRAVSVIMSIVIIERFAHDEPGICEACLALCRWLFLTL